MKKNIIVIAEFNLKPGTREKFIGFASEDSRKSLKNEEGCLVFDILLPEKEEDKVVLYEIYSDRTSFDNHKDMPHYMPFIEGTTPLLATEPTVQLFAYTDK